MMMTRRERMVCGFVLGWALVAAPARADEPKPPPGQSPAAQTREAAEVAEALRESWPDRPEWVDMLAGILDEEPMGPEFGWFRTAVSQTRFDWNSTRKRLDRNGDGRIERREFAGGDADFARLDRNHDGALTSPDFDFSGSALAPSLGSLLFARLDRDGNGKVTREELDAFVQACDSGGQGFLSLADLQEAFASPARPPSAGSGRPSKAMLVRGLFRQELGSLQPGPRLDETAPDFTLKTNDGKTEMTLSKLIGPRPVVLVFGNVTCGPFRSQAGNLEKLRRRYEDRATFLMVYVREAHPTDGWRMESNDGVGVVTAQPRTDDERAAVAQRCGRLLDLGFPMLVDTIDDTVGNRYSGMPGRLYVIDRQGKIAFKSGRGPYLFKPAELEHALILLLQEEGSNGSRARVATPSGDPPRRESPGGAPRASTPPAN